MLRSWPDGTSLTQVGSDLSIDGNVWRNVRDPLGQVGWVSADYLAPSQAPAGPSPAVDSAKPTPMGADGRSGPSSDPNHATPALVAPNPTAQATPGQAAPAISALPPGVNAEMAAVAIARPSVVQVLADRGQATSAGTGIILDTEGLILTNNHVVAGSTAIRVYLPDGQELPATLVRAIESPDLALLRIEPGTGEHLKPMTWDPAERPALGQTVIAIGFALGIEGEPSVTRGIVSANRMVNGGRFVQTDASVNHGNSGGPLVDVTGAAVGVITWGIKDQETTGLNFAIAASEVRKWLASR